MTIVVAVEVVRVAAGSIEVACGDVCAVQVPGADGYACVLVSGVTSAWRYGWGRCGVWDRGGCAEVDDLQRCCLGYRWQLLLDADG